MRGYFRWQVVRFSMTPNFANRPNHWATLASMTPKSTLPPQEDSLLRHTSFHLPKQPPDAGEYPLLSEMYSGAAVIPEAASSVYSREWVPDLHQG